MNPFLDKSVVSATFIGRAPQLTMFASRLMQVGEGSSQVILVTGEAGVGKSRLVAEARVLKNGNSTIFVEGEAKNEDGSLVAKAIGTVRARRQDQA